MRQKTSVRLVHCPRIVREQLPLKRRQPFVAYRALPAARRALLHLALKRLSSALKREPDRALSKARPADSNLRPLGACPSNRL